MNFTIAFKMFSQIMRRVAVDFLSHGLTGTNWRAVLEGRAQQHFNKS